MLTRQGKEKLVVDLYKQDKTIRDIAKEVHLSFSDICAIIKREFGPKNVESSEDNLVFKRLAKGDGPLDIAIKFDIPISQVKVLHQEYQDLCGLQELNKIYNEIGDGIRSFVQLYKTMQKLSLGPEDVAKAVKYGSDLPILELKSQKLKEELDRIESKKLNLQSEIKQLENVKVVSNQIIASLDKVLERRKNEAENLQDKILWMMASKEYTKIRDIARQQVESILTDKRALLLTTLAAVIEAFKLDPEKQILISNMTDGNPSCYMEQRKELLELAEQSFNGLANDLVSVTMNSILNN